MSDLLKRLLSVPYRPAASALPLRSGLRLLVAACVLPLVAAAVLAVYLVHQRATEATRDQAAATARLLLRSVDSELDSALAGVRLLAGSSAMERATVLTRGVMPEHLARALQGLQPQNGWVVAVLDPQGTVAARSAGPGPAVGQAATAALLAQLRSGARAGFIDSAASDPLPMLAAFERSTLSNWTVVVGRPRDAMLASVRALAWWLAGAIGVALALSVLAAHRLSARLAQTLDAERRRAVQGWQAMRLHAEQAAHAAHHDPLTGLSNRRHFVAELAAQLERSKQFADRVTVVFLDLADLRSVTDEHGPATSDKLVRAFAARLRAGVRNQDVVARLGGGEFAVLMEGLPRSMVRIIIDALNDRLSRPYRVGGVMLEPSPSIGVAHFPEDGASAAELLAAADVAVHASRAASRRVRGPVLQRAATPAARIEPSQAAEPVAGAS